MVLLSPTTTGLLIFICSFFDLQDLLSIKLLATPYSYNIPSWQDWIYKNQSKKKI